MNNRVLWSIYAVPVLAWAALAQPALKAVAQPSAPQEPAAQNPAPQKPPAQNPAPQKPAAQNPAPTTDHNRPNVLVRVLHAPAGGQSFPLDDVGVLCEAVPEPFTTADRGRRALPPSDPENVGRAVDVSVAATQGACEQSPLRVRLVVTGPFPRLAPESLVLSPDEGRIDGRGRDLGGAVLAFESGDERGEDACHTPVPDGRFEQCTWSTGKGLSADPDRNLIAVYPRGSQPGPDALFFDEGGRLVSTEGLAVKPARIVIQRLIPPDASVDLSSGTGQLSLLHPEAVASAECAPLLCEMNGDAVTVRGGTAAVDAVELSLKLRPRVEARDGDQYRTQVKAPMSILHCPMSVVSGAPFRGNEDAAVVVRLEGLCARDVPTLEFRADRRRVKVERVHPEDGGTLALLRLGRIDAGQVTITANRPGARRAVVAIAESETREVPKLRSVLSVPGYPNVDFIPQNRWAEVHVGVAEPDIAAVALPINGVYQTKHAGMRSWVRGDEHAAGLAEMHLALRSRRLPKELASTNLAVVHDPLLRGIHGANIPSPLMGNGDHKPLVEVYCDDEDGKTSKPLPMGETINLPFGVRDTCRVVFLRDRLSPEYGSQRIRFQIDVYNVDGNASGAAHVDETVTLSNGSEPRVAYVHGVLHPFDRLVVRVAHEADDTHYLGASELRTGAPEGKWSIVFGTGYARLYATTAFPTGLYRLSDREHSGVLSLNFGILSRLTWLDSEGKEGFLGLEAGLVVIGLGNAVTDKGTNLNQVGGVVGLGLSVPFANRSSATQASLNVHAWVEMDITHDSASKSDGRFAFIFGPSISIGNLGTNL